MPNLYYPTYASYREQAMSETLQQIGETIGFYRQRQAESADPQLRRCYADALRAYQDELLSREYCTRYDDADDPFFEDAVAGYEPGDLIDFGC